MVPITIEAMNGKTEPVYAGIPMLIKIPNSITDTSIIGSEIDLNTRAIIMKIAMIDIALTLAKSVSVISI